MHGIHINVRSKYFEQLCGDCFQSVNQRINPAMDHSIQPERHGAYQDITPVRIVISNFSFQSRLLGMYSSSFHRPHSN